MSLLRKLRTLRSLDRPTGLLAIRCMLLNCMIEFGFRSAGVSATQRILHRWATARAIRTTNAPAVIRQAARASAIARRNTPAACLSSSMTLWAILLRRGIESNLRVGFRHADPSVPAGFVQASPVAASPVQGHAWVEYDGVPLNDKPNVSASYSVLEGSARFDLLTSGRR